MGVVGMLVGALVVLTGLTAAAAAVSRMQIEASTARLQTRWAPTHVAAAAIRQAFTDQAAGHLGFLITGGVTDLRRYQTGRVDAARTEAELRRLLPDHPTVSTLLAELDSAEQQWRTRAVEVQACHLRPRMRLRSRVCAPVVWSTEGCSSARPRTSTCR
jgi:CHASE3 domain sensor protein